MNPEFSSVSSSTIESIRKAGIGCRGGVRVRGGRLPPVKIHNVLSKKKAIAPKIPQKRTEVKKEKIDKEAFDGLPFREDAKFREQREGRGRGRGRGARVYIQTEGTLFGDGMAFKAKSERNYPPSERISGARSKGSFKVGKKVNPEEFDSLMETYNYSEDESDSENDLKPVKYPLVKEKQEFKQEIKRGIKQEVKQEIKDEVDHDRKNFSIEDVMKSIKVEPVDDLEIEIKAKPVDCKFFTPIDAVTFSAENELVNDLNKLKSDEGIMLLLQFPSYFPFNKHGDNRKTPEDEKQKSSVPKESQDMEMEIKSNIRDVPGGFIGKLQFLKSGKMRLVMGSIQFYLETGSTMHAAANAVSISLNENEGDIIVLGKIERKMLFRPHFKGITN